MLELFDSDLYLDYTADSFFLLFIDLSVIVDGFSITQHILSLYTYYVSNISIFLYVTLLWNRHSFYFTLY